MGCNSEYLRATSREVVLSQVLCLLDELDGKPLNRSHWSGYHPGAYGAAATLVAQLCERLQTEDVTRHSLEMQIWWRDHQAADRARVVKTVGLDADRQAALAKLTPHERRLLGY